jgi:plasmid stabilization system protein ParE
MDFEIIWSPTARLDLLEIIQYISVDNPSVANAFSKKIINIIEQLKKFPNSGRIVPEFKNPNIRELIEKHYRIVYRLKKNNTQIEIGRIWHASRGIPDFK